MATGKSGAGFNTALGSLSNDPTIIDGDTSTGIDTTGSVGGTVSVTAAVSLGSSTSVTTLTYTIGYTGDPIVSCRYSNNNGGSWTNIPTSASTHSGTFSLNIGTAPGGVPLTATDIMVGLTDDTSTYGVACRATIREITVNGIVVSTVRRRCSAAWMQ